MLSIDLIDVMTLKIISLMIFGEQLGIFNFNEKLTQYKINWREYIQTMYENRLSKNKLNYKPEGSRNIGRPQTRQEDDFRRKELAKGPKYYSR